MKDSKLTITVDDTKPNLKRLRAENKDAFNNVVRTFIGLAEEAANLDNPVPWFELPSLLNDKMTLKMVASAVLRAVFQVDQLNKDTFSVLGTTLHPLSHFGERQINTGGKYSSWQKYFLLDPDAEVNEDTIEQVVRKLLYYARYIDVEKFGRALMSNQLETYRALPMENAEKLPFFPALKYQKENLGDLAVGQFWHDIGAFNCGGLTKTQYEEGECLACHTSGLVLLGDDYEVCPSCNAGFKRQAD